MDARAFVRARMASRAGVEVGAVLPRAVSGQRGSRKVDWATHVALRRLAFATGSLNAASSEESASVILRFVTRAGASSFCAAGLSVGSAILLASFYAICTGSGRRGAKRTSWRDRSEES